MEPIQVFIIAPFDSDGQFIRDAVGRAIQEIGFTVLPYRDTIRPGAEMTLSILDAIRKADLIIADVSRQNANVLYELGFAHALGKRTILLANVKSGSRLPSDLTGLHYILYDPANPCALTDVVKTEIKAYAERLIFA